MKVVILAGGRGTRLAEETSVRPKPMVEVGGRPLLWHIMRMYAHHGFKDFFVSAGYKAEYIKEYFSKLHLHSRDYRVDLSTGDIETLDDREGLDWRVSVLDTGIDTMTGGRIGRLRGFLQDGTFMATYGDGVSDVDLGAVLAFHRRHGRLATVTAVRPPARFGSLCLSGERVTRFEEKPQTGDGWINGGFFVLEPDVLSLLGDDGMPFEKDPLEALARDGELMAYLHEGFWQPMDTIRDKTNLEKMWSSGRAPWQTWDLEAAA